MDLSRAEELIVGLGQANVRGISFTAGEPLLYLDDLCKLLTVCRKHGMYTRVVSNGFWAKTSGSADKYVVQLKESGLSQLRLSYSRWHQEHVAQENILHAAQSCKNNDLEYFVSFVTDFSKEDDFLEDYLRKHTLMFFPEPMILSGRAGAFERFPIRTDYQENCCPMNPYLAPNCDMFACCDAGSHFTNTNFFYLGNCEQDSINHLFEKSENNSLYNHIRRMGISTIASFAGFRAREIVRYRKCELCEKLFNSPDMLDRLRREADSGLASWSR